ncbi:hypothetical protein PV325_002495, partial [Microctonus aethiopoides]
LGLNLCADWSLKCLKCLGYMCKTFSRVLGEERQDDDSIKFGDQTLTLKMKWGSDTVRPEHIDLAPPDYRIHPDNYDPTCIIQYCSRYLMIDLIIFIPVHKYMYRTYFAGAVIQLNLTNTTIVVCEDVDLLVLLTARTPTDKIIYFLKSGKAQHQSEIYSSKRDVILNEAAKKDLTLEHNRP